MQAAAGAFSDRIQTRQRGVGVQIGDDAAHDVVGGGSHRDGPGPVELGPLQQSEDVREPAGIDAAEVELDMVAAVRRISVEDRRRHGVARSELVGEPLPGGIEQCCSLAANGLGDQGPVQRPPGQRERRGVKLAELEVGELGARGMAQHAAGADRAPRIGGPLP